MSISTKVRVETLEGHAAVFAFRLSLKGVHHLDSATINSKIEKQLRLWDYPREVIDNHEYAYTVLSFTE